MKQHNLNMYFAQYNDEGFHCTMDNNNYGFIISTTFHMKLKVTVNGNPIEWLKNHEAT